MNILEVIYTDTKVLNYIRNRIAEVEHEITYIDKLEHRIFTQLSRYYNKRQKRSFKCIRYLVDREIKYVKSDYRLQKSISFMSILPRDDYGEQQEFEPIDVLADVEDTALRNIKSSSIRKKITGLASSDSELFVLNAWSQGLNDLQISKELAFRFGGNPKSLRIWVQRFRTRCQRKLATYR